MKQQTNKQNEATMENTIVIDIESFDTKETAVVVTLSALKFDRFNTSDLDAVFKAGPTNAFNVHIDITKQILIGRTISESTTSWWIKQSQEAKDSLISNDPLYSPEIAMDLFSEFISGYQLYSRGTDFDFKILASLYRALGKNVPWKFNQVRDVRTYIDALAETTNGYIENLNLPDWINGHNSLHDCYRDAAQMITAKAISENRSKSITKE